MSRIDPKFGLIVFDRELSTDQLKGKGSGTRDSAYTEAGPVPGQPSTEGAQWRPYMTRAQSVGLTVATLRGGFPGRDGASVLARQLSDSAASDYRSWQDPCLITGWSAPSDGWVSQTWTDFVAAVIPSSGLVIVIAVDSATQAAQTWSWDPRTDTWTTLYDWDAGTLDGLKLPIGLVYDETNERLILWSGYTSEGAQQQIAYTSDDGGTTWSQYARGFSDGTGADAAATAATGRFRVAVGDESDWAMVLRYYDSIGGEWPGISLASSDRGSEWDLVDTGLLGAGDLVRSSVGFVWVYAYHSASAGSRDLRALTISSARAEYASFTTGTVVDSSRDYVDCWATTDSDGTVYVVGQGDSGAATIGKLYAFRSLDGGLTWESYGWGVFDSTSATHYFQPHALVASAGRLHLVGTTVGSGSEFAVQIVSLGGWSQVAHGSGTANNIRTSLHRFGFGGVDADASANAWTIGYLPLSVPGNVGWTSIATTGSGTVAATEPGLRVTCTAGQARDYTYVATGKNATYLAADFAVKLDASGNVNLATLGTAGGGVSFQATLEKAATHRYRCNIDIGTDGIQLRDGSTIRATAPLDTTAQYVHVRLHLTKGTATAWYSIDGGAVWERFADGETITDGGASGSQDDNVAFGNGIAQVGKAYWRLVGVAGGADWQYGISGLTALDNTPASGPLGHMFGRCVPGKGYSYPVPFATGSAENIGHIVASGGPTRRAEAVDIPAGHEYPIEALDPALYPSPRRTWRSTTDADDVKLVYDHGSNQETWHGGALALLVIGGTPRQWILEQDDGSTGWTTLATLDLALGSSLKWSRVGRTVTVDATSTAVSRYIQEGELVGGYIDLDGDARRIAANSAGFWADATVQKVRLTLDGIDGSEASSGTAGVLVAPSGLLIYYPTGYLPRRYVRVRVAGGAVTPDGDYRAGIAAVGRVVGIGTTPGWGWSVAHQQIVAEATASDGVVTRKQLGPSKRVLQYTFSEPSQLQFLHGDGTGADYVAISGGLPIGSSQDAPLALPALLDAMLSGERPCVVVPRLPGATGTMLNPASWLYGLVRGDLTVTSQQSGTELVDEALTVSTLTVEEIR